LSVCQPKITQRGDLVPLQLIHMTVNLSACIPESGWRGSILCNSMQ